MVPVNLVANLASAADPRSAILALDAAVKAKALAAEFDWGITRDLAQGAANKRYAIEVRAVRVSTRKPDVYPDCACVGVEVFRFQPE